MCFYADTIFTVFIYLLAKHHQGTMSSEALKPLWANIAGIFFHGLAHLSLALNKETPGERELVPAMKHAGDNMQFAKTYAGLGVFWYAFMRGIFTDGTELLRIGVAMFFSSVHVFLVPIKFGFSYVALGLYLCHIYV